MDSAICRRDTPDAMKLEDIKISCMVCTLRAPPAIEALFDSLLAQEWVEGDEFVLIDNGMTDERRAEVDQRLGDFTARGIRAQCHREPGKGVVRARLRAIQAARNPWLLSLDDDNILGADAVRRIRQRLYDNPELGGICPRIEPVWEIKPEPWVVALGHQVLSYNVSEQNGPPGSWILYPPGMIGPRPPTGGMIIAKAVAEDFVRLCEQVPLILRFTPEGRRRLTGDDFILYSLIYMRGNLLTAYDDSIVVHHQIPAERTELSHLLETMFWSNYCFGIQGLMRFGKIQVFYVIMRGLGRLLYELVRQCGRVLSWRIVLAFAVGCAGFMYGTWSGLMDPECKRIRIDP
jgi:glycosyltransferase involved in cell wall biosynthesis